MQRVFVFLTMICLGLTLSVACSWAAPPATGQPGPAMRAAQAQVLGLQTRTALSALPHGHTRMMTVEDPEALAAHGLTGLAAGDEVEVTRLEDGRVQVRDPGSGRSVVLEQEEAVGD